MRIDDLAKGPVAALEPDDTLADVAREMEDNTLSAIAVCEAGELVGIISERDLIRAAADGASFERTPIEEYMTVSPVTISVSASPDDALRMMLDGEFRHVPVLDEDGDLVAMLTLRDIVRALAPAGIR